jgi:hypothetical protein
MAYFTRRVSTDVALRGPTRLEHGLGIDPLVGGQQRNAGLLQLVLDLRAEVHHPCDALHGLTHDGDEATVGPPCLVEGVGDAPVTWDRDIELFVCRAVPAQVQLRPPGRRQSR